MTVPLLRVVGPAMDFGSGNQIPFSTASFLGAFEVENPSGTLIIPRVLESRSRETRLEGCRCEGKAWEISQMERLQREANQSSWTDPNSRFDGEGRLLAAPDWIRAQPAGRFRGADLLFMNPRKGRQLAFRHLGVGVSGGEGVEITVGLGEMEGAPFRFSKTVRIRPGRVQVAGVRWMAEAALLSPLCNNRALSVSLPILAFWVASRLCYDIGNWGGGSSKFYLMEEGRTPRLLRGDIIERRLMSPNHWKPIADTFTLYNAVGGREDEPHIRITGMLAGNGKPDRVEVSLRFHPNSLAARGDIFSNTEVLFLFLVREIMGSGAYNGGAAAVPVPVEEPAPLSPQPPPPEGDPLPPRKSTLLEF